VLKRQEDKPVKHSHYFPRISGPEEMYRYLLNSSGDFAKLPKEVFHVMLLYLTLQDLVRLFSVCKGIFLLSSDDFLWKQLSYNFPWNSHLENNKKSCCWKSHFLSKYTSPEEENQRREEKIQLHNRIANKHAETKNNLEILTRQENSEKEQAKKILNNRKREVNMLMEGLLMVLLFIYLYFNLFWPIIGIPSRFAHEAFVAPICDPEWESFFCFLGKFVCSSVYALNGLVYLLLIYYVCVTTKQQCTEAMQDMFFAEDSRFLVQYRARINRVTAKYINTRLELENELDLLKVVLYDKNWTSNQTLKKYLPKEKEIRDIIADKNDILLLSTAQQV